MSKEKRIKERSAWRELQIIIKGYRLLGFDYIIKRLPPARICFGSSQERSILPLKWSEMSPLMVRVLPKQNYVDDKMTNLKATKKQLQTQLDKNLATPGYGVMSSKVQRFVHKTSKAKILNPNDLDKPIKQSWQPFNRCLESSTKKLRQFVTPGPSTYNTQRKRKYIYNDSFGGRRRVIPATQTLCQPTQLTECDGCNQIVPRVDYWQNFDLNKAYCRQCMACEIQKATYRARTKSLKFKRLAELMAYTRVRNCDYHHEHQNTTASVKLLSQRELNRKFRTENYLSMFRM